MANINDQPLQHFLEKLKHQIKLLKLSHFCVPNGVDEVMNKVLENSEIFEELYILCFCLVIILASFSFSFVGGFVALTLLGVLPFIWDHLLLILNQHFHQITIPHCAMPLLVTPFVAFVLMLIGESFISFIFFTNCISVLIFSHAALVNTPTKKTSTLHNEQPVVIDNENQNTSSNSENLEQEQQEKLEKERLEKEKLEKEKQEKLEQERLEKESLEKEKLEKEKLEKEKQEQERLEKERLEKDKLEQERLEQERLEQERLEQERLEQERLEQERLEKERLEKERLEKEKQEEEEESEEEDIEEVVEKYFIIYNNFITAQFWTGFQTFKTLYDSERDGIENKELNKRIVGHENVMIIIQTTEGHTFGSFNKAEIPELEDNKTKIHNDEQHFAFTLTNPNSISSMKVVKNDSSKSLTIHSETSKKLLSCSKFYSLTSESGWISDKFSSEYKLTPEVTPIGSNMFTGSCKPETFSIKSIYAIEWKY